MPPHATHDVPSQVSIALVHVAIEQQGAPRPPHATQVPEGPQAIVPTQKPV